jgi:hypothetical protein
MAGIAGAPARPDRPVHYTIICEEDSRHETPPLAPNNVGRTRSLDFIELEDDATIVVGLRVDDLRTP